MTTDKNLNMMARQIFKAALTEDRAGELLQAFFDGASATVGPDGKLFILPHDQVMQLVDNDDFS